MYPSPDCQSPHGLVYYYIVSKGLCGGLSAYPYGGGVDRCGRVSPLASRVTRVGLETRRPQHVRPSPARAPRATSPTLSMSLSPRAGVLSTLNLSRECRRVSVCGLKTENALSINTINTRTSYTVRCTLTLPRSTERGPPHSTRPKLDNALGLARELSLSPSLNKTAPHKASLCRCPPAPALPENLGRKIWAGRSRRRMPMAASQPSHD